jgi:hypothetical protein
MGLRERERERETREREIDIYIYTHTSTERETDRDPRLRPITTAREIRGSAYIEMRGGYRQTCFIIWGRAIGQRCFYID